MSLNVAESEAEVAISWRRRTQSRRQIANIDKWLDKNNIAITGIPLRNMNNDKTMKEKRDQNEHEESAKGAKERKKGKVERGGTRVMIPKQEGLFTH